MTNAAEAIVYRDYRPGDYEQLVGVLGVTGSLDVRRDTPDIYGSMTAARPGSIQVAEYVPAARIVGGCLSDMPHPIIGSLAVHPNFQGQGIGTKILEQMIVILRNEGHKFVELLINQSNTGLRTFYEERDFRVTDTCLLLERSIAPDDSPSYQGANIDAITPEQAFDVIYRTPSPYTAPKDMRVAPILQVIGEDIVDLRETAAINILLHQAKAPWETGRPMHWGRLALADQVSRPRMIHTVWSNQLHVPERGVTLVKWGDGRMVGVDWHRMPGLAESYAIGGLKELLREDAKILLHLQGVQGAGSLALRRNING